MHSCTRSRQMIPALTVPICCEAPAMDLVVQQQGQAARAIMQSQLQHILLSCCQTTEGSYDRDVGHLFSDGTVRPFRMRSLCAIFMTCLLDPCKHCLSRCVFITP